jgi:hypothetical protein
LTQAQAAVQRARSQCHAHIYEHVDLISKRLYELKVTSEWLHQGMLGRFDLVSQGEMHGRQSPDRRNDIDRRIAGMRKHLLSLAGNSTARATSAPNRGAMAAGLMQCAT